MLGRVKIALLQDLFIKVLVLCNLWQVPSASGSSTLSERGLCEAGLGQGSVSGGAHSWRSVFPIQGGSLVLVGAENRSSCVFLHGCCSSFPVSCGQIILP